MPSSHYLWETPARADEDFFIRRSASFLARLESFSDEIVNSARAGSPASVYCISARWGTGKSSALEVLKAKVEAKAKDEDCDVTFTVFHAPIHATQGSSARLGLVAEIVFSMGPAVIRDLADSLSWHDRRAGSDDLVESAPLAGFGRYSIPRTSIYEKLVEFSAGPLQIENFIARELREILDFHRASGSGAGAEPTLVDPPSQKLAHVVFIEDLDRTTTEYTAEILQSLTFWREVANIFFVVTCSKSHLVEASKLLPQSVENLVDGSPLSKHIHHIIDLPEFVPNADVCADYVVYLLEKVDLRGRGPDLLALVRGDKARRQRLLAPLLDLRRPRDIKEKLNRLLAEFYAFPDAAGDTERSGLAPDYGGEVDSSLVKRLVAQTMWPDEFVALVSDVLIPTPDEDVVTAEVTARRIHYQIALELATQAWSTSKDDPALWLRSVADGAKVDLSSWPIGLLVYLADDPPLWPQAGPGGGPAAHGGSSSRPVKSPSGGDSYFEILDPVESPPRFVPVDVKRGGAEGLPDVISRLQVALDVALESDEAETARELLDELRALLVARQGDLDTSLAPVIGNVALRAARLDTWSAWQLHGMAHRLAPTHTNIRLNIADFLIDNTENDPDALRVALDHVEWGMANDPTFRPDRARHLRFRILAATTSGDEELRGEVPDRIAYVVREEGDALWVELISCLMSKLRWYEEGELLVRQLVTDRPERSFMALRGWADLMAEVDSDAAQRRRAMDVFRWLCCESGLPFDQRMNLDAAQVIADTAHNFATLLYVFDYDAIAAVVWRWIYEQGSDAVVRRAYSRLMSDYLGDKETALRILNGQEILLPVPTDEEARQAAQLLPERFHDGETDPWWETMPIETSARRRQQEHFLHNFARSVTGG